MPSPDDILSIRYNATVHSTNAENDELMSSALSATRSEQIDDIEQYSTRPPSKVFTGKRFTVPCKSEHIPKNPIAPFNVMLPSLKNPSMHPSRASADIPLERKNTRQITTDARLTSGPANAKTISLLYELNSSFIDILIPEKSRRTSLIPSLSRHAATR